MSIHPSLALSLKGRKQRSVLKRIERIKYFMDKGSFNRESSSVFGLPKIKVMKIKVMKKEKAESAAPGAAASGASAAASAKTAVPAAKTAK